MIIDAMIINEWLLLAMACFAGAASPGPSLVLLMRSVVAGGRRAGWVFAFAHGAGVLVYAGIVSIGLAALILVNTAIFALLQIAGILLLFFISIGMIRGGLKKSTLDLPKAQALSASLYTHARDGFMIVFLNPKIAAFFLAVFSQFLTDDAGLGGRVAMTAIAWMIDTAWYAFIAMMLTMPAVAVYLHRHSKPIEAGLGVMLLLAGFGICINFVISL